MHRYESRMQSTVFIPIIVMLSALMRDEHIHPLFYSIPIILSLVCCIRFYCTIHDETIHYSAKLFTFTLFQAHLTPPMIHTVEFHRSNWTDRKAVIRRREGMRIALTNFAPDNITTILEQFCLTHDITIQKHRDYIILEKRDARKQNNT